MYLYQSDINNKHVFNLSEEDYGWNGKAEKYELDKKEHPVSMIEAILIGWGNKDFLEELKLEAATDENVKKFDAFLKESKSETAKKRIREFLKNSGINN